MAAIDDIKSQADRLQTLVKDVVAAIQGGVSPAVLQPIADELKTAIDAIVAALPAVPAQ